MAFLTKASQTSCSDLIWQRSTCGPGQVSALLYETRYGYSCLMWYTSGRPSGIRYILVHEDEQVDTFPTLQDAFDEGIRRYGVPPFRVIEEREDDNNSVVPFIPVWTPSKYDPGFNPQPYAPPDSQPYAPPDSAP
jgi:hypothetical protein